MDPASVSLKRSGPAVVFRFMLELWVVALGGRLGRLRRPVVTGPAWVSLSQQKRHLAVPSLGFMPSVIGRALGVSEI